ncbi:MAG: hypothetical protein GY862_32790, partial [Gammaproteobacteria bacterium]|nr:hypothetical protein [Gammaproteobacteria bacterium]
MKMINITMGLFFLLFCGSSAAAWDSAETRGKCSPVIQGDIHNSSIKIDCGETIPAAAVASLEAALNRKFQDFFGGIQDNLRLQTESARNLNAMIGMQRGSIEKLRAEVTEWENNYRGLQADMARIRAESPDDEFIEQQTARAETALKQGDFPAVLELLAPMLDRQEREVSKAAHNHFTVARAHLLNFQPDRALP